MPYLTEDYYINFYGGEPFLSFELIRKVVSFIKIKDKNQDKKAHYSLTTNGSLLSNEIIQFLDKHKFSVELSFDGLAQDVSRQKGSREKIVPIIKEILAKPNINLEINSVFSPETVSYLSDSIKYIVDLGVHDIRCSISTTKPWSQDSLKNLEEEMSKLRRNLLFHFKKESYIPVVNFRNNQKKGIFSCAAGKDRLAISPDGGIWGCFLFTDHYKEKENSLEYSKFFFGDLDYFMKHHEKVYPQISSNYAQLRMDNFRTSRAECFLCKKYKTCVVCPINAALSGSPLGQIPNHICEIQRIQIREKYKFIESL